MFVKLKDTGGVFQETGQRKVVKGTRIVELKNSETVERAKRQGILEEVTEADYNEQVAADKTLADQKANTQQPVAVTVVPPGGAVGDVETPEAKAARETAEKLAKLNPDARKHYDSLTPEKQAEYLATK